MFVGRAWELDQLNSLYAKSSFQFAVVYGRRRVGKTALISQFVHDKASIFFTGVESNEKQNLENFSQCIMHHVSGLQEAPVFTSFQAALTTVFELSLNKRLVLVIDEYPYVARASSSLASTLQMLIDQYREHAKLFLILCGSSMSFMEDQVLAYKSPLYGRRTAQMKILPFDYFDCRHFLPNYSAREVALVYGVLGGTPQYLQQFDDQLTVDENIRRHLLNPVSALFDEPISLLKQEVREAGIYNAIISTIANGASRLSEIAGKVGETTGACAIYLRNLIDLGIVKKETPLTERTSRKTIYTIEDGLFRFWYRFVPHHISMLSRGQIDPVWNRISPLLSMYMGLTFEEICKQFLWRLNATDRAAFPFTQMGRWWGTDAHRRDQAEIDIIAIDEADQALFAECKWTGQKVDASVLETLIDRSRMFHQTTKHYYLFAQRGYTSACLSKVKQTEHTQALTLEDMHHQIK